MTNINMNIGMGKCGGRPVLLALALLVSACIWAPGSSVAALVSARPYVLTVAPEPLKLDGPLSTRTVAGPTWAQNQAIYEVKLDAYAFPKGQAFTSYERYLPALKEMGVGLVWFMPIYPRGQKKAFGSSYSVRDYRGVDPDFGSPAEFAHMVDRAHTLGLRVLLDWVPNHTAWDNPWIDAHPEFYLKNSRGEIAQAYSWTDVAQLDYGKPGAWNYPLWNQMRDNMIFWLRDFQVDGFRCDDAGRGGKVPVEFWNWLRPQLNAVRPVFMLAEADDAYLHPAFDMTYSWNLPPVLWDICAGRKPATAIDSLLRQEAVEFPDGAIRMRFLDNHDWHPNADWGWGRGPAIETSGGMKQVAPLMVLCATLPGKPLLYNGQEMSFLKTGPPPDPNAALGSPVWSFYHQLLLLYQSDPAIYEGSFTKLVSNDDDKVYAFVRQRGKDRVLVAVNLSGQPQTAALIGTSLGGEYHDCFGSQAVTLSTAPSLQFEPWGYHVLVAAP